ncbi:cation efflux family-domain-containing protein [Amylocystis lapponica]|nr:cation efflux family-domain-containing protein [Amylocystis lapponica]
MATLTARRTHSSQAKGKEPEHRDGEPEPKHHAHKEHPHSHEHEHGHSHSHSHSIFGAMTHTHAPGEGHTDAEQIVEALKGGGDRGSRITLIGLVSNVGLTASKGAAGWYMNSASLLADAGHSLSDLLGDFVTLICWKLSRRPPSELYPYGFGKFEVLGTATVSLLLTGGALGIGIHSWSLLVDALTQTATTLPEGALHDVLANAADIAQSVPVVATEHAHAHAHAHAHSLDPNAAWFAAVSVVAKEWLYRVTKRVADDERSPVLRANAIHHRSDAYSSMVALVAILGSWWFPHLPLDPIGGLLVCVLIFRQGWSILVTALHQLTDGSVSPKTRTVLLEALEPLLPEVAASAAAGPAERLLAVQDLRAMRAGALMFVDLVAHVPRTLSIEEASSLEDRITRTLKAARKEISEVRVRFRPVDEGSR